MARKQLGAKRSSDADCVRGERTVTTALVWALGPGVTQRMGHRALTAERPHPTSWEAYALHNRITAAAQAFGLVQRTRLERIGGDLLYRVSSN